LDRCDRAVSVYRFRREPVLGFMESCTLSHHPSFLRSTPLSHGLTFSSSWPDQSSERNCAQVRHGPGRVGLAALSWPATRSHAHSRGSNRPGQPVGR
jgi:hypothetical protein